MPVPPGLTPLQMGVFQRTYWFYETQLRGLNLATFRDGSGAFVRDGDGKPLDSISDWSNEERAQRAAFARDFIGKTGDWLNFKSPKKLLEKLATAKKECLDHLDSIDGPELDRSFPRQPPDKDELFHAVSRLEISVHKPWLIPDLYGLPLGEFLRHEKAEIDDVFLRSDDQKDPRDFHTQSRSQRKLINVNFLSDDKKTYSIRVTTRSTDGVDAAAYPHSGKAKYWLHSAGQDSLIKDLYFHKENSDMGLTHAVKLLYLYGTLPDHFLTKEIIWRRRGFTEDQRKLFHQFKAAKALAERDETVRKAIVRNFDELEASLDKNALEIGSCDLRFSLITEEILKQAMLRYKFWMDEPFRVLGNESFNELRKSNGYGDSLQDKEMQFWSENHYILFASAEYLVGQLFPDEEFHTAKDFLPGKVRDLGKMKGSSRRERGKARVLKYLNNRLTLGFAEFNSAGYYREHFEPLTNLVDFSLDDEVREKALMVLDLLLFDVARFTHKGSFGAANGRCQFKFKSSGWDSGVGDLIEIAFGTRGAFVDGESAVGGCLAASSYRIPEVLLQIGSNPPTEPFIDRSRISITFDEALNYGIGGGGGSLDTAFQYLAYSEKLAKHSPHIKAVNDRIAETHSGYGQREDDMVFWWTLSAFFTKQVIRNTMEMVRKFSLKKTSPFDALGTLFGDAELTDFLGFLPGISSIEERADDLSVMVEGSVRTQANLYTHRSRDAMMAAVQNFRVGQLNFQSTVHQATFNTETSVFTNSPYQGSSIPWTFAALAGAVVFGPIGAGVAIGLNEALLKDGDLAGIMDHDDGPGWWTGYWALPLVVQYKNTAIIMYDFHTLQKEMTDCASHIWLPVKGFDEHAENVEPNSENFDDTSSFLGDIAEAFSDAVDENGIWFFARLTHRVDDNDSRLTEEAYLGVFSNQVHGPLNAESDFYSDLVEEQTDNALEELQDNIEDKLDDLEDEDNVGYVGRQAIEIVVRRMVASNMNKDQIREELQTKGSAMIRSHLNAIVELAELCIQEKEPLKIWGKGLVSDCFADKDRYADGKNIWIMHVGTRAEFGNFETFKERLKNATIKLDDIGDMECSYAIPQRDGATESLSVFYESREAFVNGEPLSMRRYPRFENPFVRGGAVEWRQREYTIEYNGERLGHDFRHYAFPRREVNQIFFGAERDLVKALVIYVETTDEDLDRTAVARGTVTCGCETAAEGEIVAVGPADDETSHEAEWIFFRGAVDLSPDMGIVLSHSSSAGDKSWSMLFRLKALLADNSLVDCSPMLHASPINEKFDKTLVRDYGASKVYRNRFQLEFDDDHQDSGFIPFSVRTNRWRDWREIDTVRQFPKVAVVRPGAGLYFPHFHLIGMDSLGSFSIKKCVACQPPSSLQWLQIGPERRFGALSEFVALELVRDSLTIFVRDGSELYMMWCGPADHWSNTQWTQILVEHEIIPAGSTSPVREGVPLAINSKLEVFGQGFSDIRVLVLGMDRRLYTRSGQPSELSEVWMRVHVNPDMDLSGDVDFIVFSKIVFLSDSKGRLFALPAEDLDQSLFPRWNAIVLPAGVTLVPGVRLAGVDVDGVLTKLVVTSTSGEVWCADYYGPASDMSWERVGQRDRFTLAPNARLSCVSSELLKVHVSGLGVQGEAFVNYWTPADGWEGGHGWTRLDFEGSFHDDFALPLVSRTEGQLEVFGRAESDRLQYTWWS